MELRKQAVLEKSLLSKEEVAELLLDAQDVEMIKKVKELDMENPTDVKKYVQDIRTQSYKNNLSQEDMEQERE